ncbi:hypothetical protein LTR66_001094 [Elasticomyces elasticus]|nr:hypothetical protein LTR66_001094 [Elasticomyces elasticus]
MGSEAFRSFLEQFEQSGPCYIPRQLSSACECCCGNAACVYLQHSLSSLAELEHDVRTAAKLGQALLARHEAYAADAEKDRLRMTAEIEELRENKRTLEDQNAKVVAENRSLLDHLESLNDAVAESDFQVQSLTATLHATQRELENLAHLATKTEQLEHQLVHYEKEQAELRQTVSTTADGERLAVRRWQKAESELNSLQEQLQRIEQEAAEEKERHVELMGRMERRRAVERELKSAAGRLKDTATARTVGRIQKGNNVVSHFVKDILQDNANLQIGIVELREMLQTSNDEVETLREQLTHRPEVDMASQRRASSPAPTLDTEMLKARAQELHVHHHYHAPPTPAESEFKSRTQTLRRSKKKRYGITAGHFTPPLGTHAPKTPPRSRGYETPSSASAILAHTAVSIPTYPAVSRWSLLSNRTTASTVSSSTPSSPPPTSQRASSLSDRVFSDAGMESSRPTTPDTEDPGSPLSVPAGSKRVSSSIHRSLTAPTILRAKSSESPALRTLHELQRPAGCLRRTQTHSGCDAILEESKSWLDSYVYSTDVGSGSTSTPTLPEETEFTLVGRDVYSRPLRRAASHESLLPAHGMAVHTLKSRPCQLLAFGGGHSFSTQPVISAAIAHAARPSAPSRVSSQELGRSLRSGAAADQRMGGRVLNSQKNNIGFGSKVGGWVRGRWGATPTPTENIAAQIRQQPMRPKLSSAHSTTPVPVGSQDAVHRRLKRRPPGVNQSGPILDIGCEPKSHVMPMIIILDEEALRRALEE